MGAAITENDDNICNCDNDHDDNAGDDVYKLLRIIQISSYNRFCQQKFEIPTWQLPLYKISVVFVEGLYKSRQTY